jgi:branched-chain amino acid transport system ATP-binding protein
MTNAAPSPTTVLECRGVSAGYGAITAVRDLDLYVEAGEIVALMGPNGAGKTSTLLTIAGELEPQSGTVHLLGDVVTKSPMFIRCRRGMGFVTEERSVIMGLTAEENLRLAGVSTADAIELFAELKPLMRRKAGLLSGGEQQMLTLARALSRDIKILLADELSLGLAPLIVDRLLEAVRRAARDRDVAVVLVEQHVRKALQYADRAYVMQRGQIVLSGTAFEIRSRLPEVEAAYLSTFDAS